MTTAITAANTSPTAPRDAGRPTTSPLPLRVPSLVAGIGLLVMAAIAVFTNFIVVEGLVTPGDAAATAADVMTSETMFRLGIVGWVAIAALDVVVAWALFHFFAPADEGVSRLAAWLRLVYSAVLLIATTHLSAAVRLLDSGQQLAGSTSEQLQSQALLSTATFTDVWDAGLVLFGLHLVALGWLAYRAGYAPKLLGLLLGIAGAGYVIDSVSAVLGQPTNLSAITFVGEFLLAIWLLTRGRRVLLEPRDNSAPTIR
jgi:hypothetical protein